MQILGYSAAIAIGLSMGIFGGGGSILAIPILVYIFGVDPILATLYSLFIVGTTSVVGGVPKYLHGTVNFKTALLFGVPSIVAVLLTRALILPAIPMTIFRWGEFELTKGVFLMVLFAVLMIGAALAMIRNKKLEEITADGKAHESRILHMMVEGMMVGMLTGLVGAGGGFLIVPALVMFGKLPMKMAVGTSLIIMAANTTIGFFGSLPFHRGEIHWLFLLSFTFLAIIGIFAGHRMSKMWDSNKLKRSFGKIILVIGLLILINEGLNMFGM